MQPEARQHRIAEFLQQVEFASLDEIAQQVDASVSTVRRDLTVLEATGNMRRTHGGARIVNPRTRETFVLLSVDGYEGLKEEYDDSPWTREELEALAWEAS